MTFRSAKKQAKEVYLYEPINGDDGEGNSISLLDLLETTDEDVAERMEIEENVKKLYKYVETALTDREKEIIRLRYGLPKNRNANEKNELPNGKLLKNTESAEAM